MQPSASASRQMVMQETVVPEPVTPEMAMPKLSMRERVAPSPWRASWPMHYPSPTPLATTSDAAFVTLQNAYRHSGGLANGNEVAARLHVDGAGGYARLARWMVGQQVFSFGWHDDFWLPMFQFDPHDMSLRPGLRLVLAELVGVMDGWALAHWLVQPNASLRGCSPLDVWATRGPDLLDAARQQRFVMKG
jgi:hypothetical protein